MEEASSKSVLDRPFSILGITFAPINISLERRLQTLGVLFIMWCWLFSSLTIVYASYRVLWVDYFRWIPLAYLAFIIRDSNTAFSGGRSWPSCRGWSVWRWSRDYFPVQLVKTEDLDPDNNYVLGSHPHGLFCFGSFITFGTDAMAQWDTLFPGLKRRLVALNLMFYLPGMREIALLCGSIAASSASIKNVLRQKGSGVTSIMVGGAKESLLVSPDADKVSLILRNRRGFVRLALEEGAHLVPSFTFGEQHCYSMVRNPEGSRIRAFQEKWKQWLTFSPVLFYGRGIFQYSFGLLPRRHPITVVIGGAIPVQKVDNPTAEMIDVIHSRYVAALRGLYDKHNPIYGDPRVKLEII